MPDGLIRSSAPMMLTTDAVGGVWRYTIDLARALPIPPVVAVLGPSPSVAQRAEAAGFRLVDTGLSLDWTAETPADLAAATAGLRALADRTGVSSVHLHAPALAGSDRWALPVVAVAHSCVATWWRAVRSGPLPPGLAWRADATGTGLRTADAVIAPTRAHADATRRVYGDTPVTVVHNGAGPSLTPSSSRSGEGRAAASVLTAGRLWDEAKNAAALNRAAPDLDAPIRAAGPTAGPDGASIDLPNLHRLGSLATDAMHRAYADATVFASLARYEPFGLSVLEAARAGLRLVLSDIPSFRELWDGVARFVPPGTDPVPTLRAALADTGPNGAADRASTYTVEAMAQGTLAVHRRLGVRV